MAKTKSKSKSKFDFKQFLLKRGEYLAMGTAGFFLFLLLLWGVTKWSSAKDPDKITKDLTQKAQSVQTQISKTEPTDADRELAKVPEWVDVPYKFKDAPVRDFALTGPPFDPTAKPDTKKENPSVLPIGAYQVDLIRGGMKGFDIIEGKDGDRLIAVIYDKQIDPQDHDKANSIIKNVKRRGQQPHKKKGPLAGGQPPGGFRPGGKFPGGGQFPPGGGSLGPPGGGGSMRGPGGDLGSPGGSKFGNPYGGGGGEYSQNSQRVEKSIEYVPISQLDAALKKQKAPAMTVIPVRMITIHAEIPLKKQIEEIRRDLRLPNSAEAARWGPFYDGYEVQRRVSVMSPDGKLEVTQDWADYNFEDQYREKINSLRAEDHLDNEYLANFMRYEMALALPLPELVEETGSKYPDIRLKNILDTIKKLQDANKGKVEPSELLKHSPGRHDPRRSATVPKRGSRPAQRSVGRNGRRPEDAGHGRHHAAGRWIRPACSSRRGSGQLKSGGGKMFAPPRIRTIPTSPRRSRSRTSCSGSLMPT